MADEGAPAPGSHKRKVADDPAARGLRSAPAHKVRRPSLEGDELLPDAAEPAQPLAAGEQPAGVDTATDAEAAQAAPEPEPEGAPAAAAAASLEDLTLKCVECTENFVFSGEERAFYLATFRRDTLPQRCKKCRQAKKKRFADYKAAHPPAEGGGGGGRGRGRGADGRGEGERGEGERGEGERGRGGRGGFDGRGRGRGDGGERGAAPTGLRFGRGGGRFVG